MRRVTSYRTTLAVAVLAAMLLVAPMQNATAAGIDRSVILLTWDGVRWDHLQYLLEWQPASEEPRACPSKRYDPVMPELCGEFWSCLPTICGFQILPSRVAPGKTLTRIQHAAMLTGLPSEVTGIFTNSGSSSVPPGTTIYERLAAALPTPPSMGHIGSVPYTVRGILTWAKGTALPAENILSRGGRDGGTGFTILSRLVGFLTQFRDDQFFIFAHFKGPDIVAHKSGDRGVVYDEAIVLTDKRLAELMSKLGELGINNSTTVYITTDHGFSGRFHHGPFKPIVANTFFASSAHDLACFGSTTALEVTPTILATMGATVPRTIALPGRSLHLDSRQGACAEPVCGDGDIQPGEDCEPSRVLAETCTDLGLLRGTLDCRADCAFDATSCIVDHPYVNGVRFRGIDKAAPKVMMRSKSKERGGIDHRPATHSYLARITTATNGTWSCGIEPGAPGWDGDGSTRRWNARKYPCGLRKVKLNVNENRPFASAFKAQHQSIAIPAPGETIILTETVGGAEHEIVLRCHAKSENAIDCVVPED